MINIAIDGPSGAGKSTLARKIAKHFGYIYVDTGALYRAVGLFAVRNNVNLKDANNVNKLLPNIKLELSYINGEQCVILNSEDVSKDIRQPAISMAASDVSAIPEVRSFLFDLQKDMAEKNNVVMDGRDIGTVVLPNACVKIFLTATPAERATRRFEELMQKGIAASFDDVLSDIKLRDFNDSNREIAPLKPASDSITVDTTGFEMEKSLEVLINVIKDKLYSNKI
jgi:cytidylate kinase